MKTKKTMLTILSIVLGVMLLASCQEANNNPEAGTAKSITVRIADMTGAKTITPSGNVDVSHYKITVKNTAEDINKTSEYLAKGEAFTVSNVPAGLWTATVDAYVLNSDSNYVKVASATSAPTRVEGNDEATLTVTLDELDDSVSGDVTVTLDMPAELDDNGDSFYYTYTIAGTGQRNDYSYETPDPLEGSTGADGNAVITIDADGIDPVLNQGSYLLTVTVFDQTTEKASDVIRKGVEIMRLLPGLAASGTINLNSQIINTDGFQVAITDKIGDKLDLGGATYDDFATDTTITIDYNGISTDTPVDVYVDGAKKTIAADYTATPGSGNVAYKFTAMDAGRHIVTFILDEADTQLGVGSLSVEVNIPAEITFSPVTG